MKTQLVLVNLGTIAQAEEIAAALVAARLAACVNIIPGLRSIYEWQGKIEHDSEVLLLIKSSAQKMAALEEKLLSLHPYDTPEFIVIDPVFVTPKYQAWLNAVLDSN